MTAERNLDPIILEIVRNSLDTIVDQMSTVIARTASSLNIREALDFSTGFATEKGELVAIGSGAPLQCVCMAGGLNAFMEKYGENISSGDVFIANDPYQGTGHLPDIAIGLPIFVHGKLAAWALTTCHHGDVGGRMPGGNASDSTEIFQEGIRIPPLKLYEKGEPNDSVFTLLRANTRLPDNIVEDMRSQLSACRVGEKAYLELVEKYGAREIRRYSEELINYGERITRDYIAKMPDGVYEFEDFIDPLEGHAVILFPLEIDLDLGGGRLDSLDPSGPPARAMEYVATGCEGEVAFKSVDLLAQSIPIDQPARFERPLD